MAIAVDWKYVLRDGKPIIKICCPQCGVWGDISDHLVNTEGFVEPSIICDCGFHEMVYLTNYNSKETKGN